MCNSGKFPAMMLCVSLPDWHGVGVSYKQANKIFIVISLLFLKGDFPELSHLSLKATDRAG